VNLVGSSHFLDVGRLLGDLLAQDLDLVRHARHPRHDQTLAGDRGEFVEIVAERVPRDVLGTRDPLLVDAAAKAQRSPTEQRTRHPAGVSLIASGLDHADRAAVLAARIGGPAICVWVWRASR
jgi:hypothetical protein